MSQSRAAVALVVADYDEALDFFTRRLRFEVVKDSLLPGGKRWGLVRPRGGGTALLLARAATPEQASRVGDQTGGRVFLFLHTDDFWRDYRDMQFLGVRFTEEPREEGYGTVAVFLELADLRRGPGGLGRVRRIGCSRRRHGSEIGTVVLGKDALRAARFPPPRAGLLGGQDEIAMAVPV